MSASQVLNAPTYTRPLWRQMTLYKSLTFPTVQALKAHSLKRASKNFTQLVDARKSRFAPNTTNPLCAKETRHLTRFARNSSIQRSPHP